MTPHKRHVAIYNFLRFFAYLIVKIKFNYSCRKEKKSGGPYIIISNHVTDFDMLMVAQAFPEHMYFVMGEQFFRRGWVSKLLDWSFSPIPRKKATNAASTVLEIMRRMRLGSNVCLFAEGCRTYDGRLNPISESTAALVKRLKCTLVTFRIEGGFLSSPRWSRTVRRGFVRGVKAGEYTAEQLAKMEQEDIMSLIKRDISEDVYAAQANKPVAYKGKRLAEDIHLFFVACPKCGRLGSIKSSANSFYCDCGLRGTYNKFGYIKVDGIEFKTPAAWGDWQLNYIQSLQKTGDDKTLCSSPDVTLTEILEKHGQKELCTGTLRATESCIAVENEVFNYSDIAGLETFQHGFIVFTLNDGRYMELRSKVKFPGYLYKLLYYHFR